MVAIVWPVRSVECISRTKALQKYIAKIKVMQKRIGM